MVGHDFTTGERQGAKGYPRFTDPGLRGPDAYHGYLRSAAEASLERCGADAFDVLLLHNPDRTGYSSPAVWDAMSELARAGAGDRDRSRAGTCQRLHARHRRRAWSGSATGSTGGC